VTGVVIEDASDLHIALDHLHDRWFDLEAVVFDRARMEVTFPFWSNPGWRSPRDRSTGAPKPFDRVMTVLHVLDYVVSDTEHIAVYSFNDMKFGDGSIAIRADPKLSIRMRVEKLEIRLEEIHQH
jgi:hypothetical protein